MRGQRFDRHAVSSTAPRPRCRCPRAALLGVAAWFVLATGTATHGTADSGSAASGSAAPGAPPTKAATEVPAAGRARARARLRVDADSLRITLDLPKAALASAGVLAGSPSDDVKSAVVDRDSLSGYLRFRLITLQDDGLLQPAIRRIQDASGASTPTTRVELVAGLLDTYTHIGFASGLFLELSPPIPTHVQIEWREARAEFDASQSIQWIEPPAKGAKTLELPGRGAPAGH